MTKFTLGLLALSMTAGSVFAQDYLQCDLKIINHREQRCNTCPENVLKNSKTTLKLELNDGAIISGALPVSRVYKGNAYDGKMEKLKNFDVIAFADDPNLVRLAGPENRIWPGNVTSEDSINYNVSQNGDTVDIRFNTADQRFDITLWGNAQYSLYTVHNDRALIVKCKKSNKAPSQNLTPRDQLEKYSDHYRNYIRSIKPPSASQQ